MLHCHMTVPSASALKAFSLPHVQPPPVPSLVRVSSESCPHLLICLWHSTIKACRLLSAEVGCRRSAPIVTAALLLLSAPPLCVINCVVSLLARLDSPGLEIRSPGHCPGSYEVNKMESAGRGLHYSSPRGKDPECNDRCAGSLPHSASPLLVKCLLIQKVQYTDHKPVIRRQ